MQANDSKLLSEMADLFLLAHEVEVPTLALGLAEDSTDQPVEYNPAADNNRPPKDEVLKQHDTGERPDGINYQRCGGGRRIIRKKIGNA